MECPNCGTFNPDDRQNCWRCDAVLPTPKPKKKRDAQSSAKLWLYIAIAVFAVVTILQTCGISVPGLPSGESSLPALPTILTAYVGGLGLL